MKTVMGVIAVAAGIFTIVMAVALVIDGILFQPLGEVELWKLLVMLMIIPHANVTANN